MPIFYTDVPLNISASNTVTVTSSQANPVWVTGTGMVVTSTFTGSVPISAGSSAPLYVTFTGSLPLSGVAVSDAGSSLTVDSNAGALGVSGTVGVTQAGAWTVQVSGTSGAPVYIGQTASFVVNTGTMPVVTVTASTASPVGITGTVFVNNPGGLGGVQYGTGSNPTNNSFTGTLALAVSGTGAVALSASNVSGALWVQIPASQVVTVSQSNIPAGTMQVSGVWPGGAVLITASSLTPVFIGQTASFVVNTGTFPTVTVATHAVTQGGAWASLVSGTVGVTGTYAGGAVLITASSATPVYVAFTGNLPLSGVAITDGGGSITVDGGVSVTQGGALATLVSGTVGVTGTYPGGAVLITASSTAPVYIGQTGSVWITASSTAPVYIGQTGSINVSQSNNPVSITASQDKAGTSTLVTIEVGNASTTLLASNANRKGATIFAVDQVVFIGLGQTPTVNLYHAKVPSSSYYEIPWNFTGQVNAIASVSGQTVNVGEFTA